MKDIILSSYLWFAIPLVVLLLMLLRRQRIEREPERGGIIVPQSMPPEGMTPAEVYALFFFHTGGFERNVLATIIHLAHRGYLKIIEQEKRRLFGLIGKVYVFQKLKDFDNELKEYERLILEGIFGSNKQIALNDLRNKFYRNNSKIRKSLYDQMIKDGYFEGNPFDVMNKYAIPGIAIFIAGIVSLFIALIKPGIALIVTGILPIISGVRTPVKTRKAISAKRRALGFKSFLHTLKHIRSTVIIDFETFEKYLPYAIVLGVEKDWVRRVDDIKPPDWYVSAGSSMDADRFLKFIRHISYSLSPPSD